MPGEDTNFSRFPTAPEIVDLIQYKNILQEERVNRLNKLNESVDLIDPIIISHLSSIDRMEKYFENMGKAFEEAIKAPAKPPKRHEEKKRKMIKKRSASVALQPAVTPQPKSDVGIGTQKGKKKRDEKIKDPKKMPPKPRGKKQFKSAGPKVRTPEKTASKPSKQAVSKEPLVNKVKRQLNRLKISTAKKPDKAKSNPRDASTPQGKSKAESTQQSVLEPSSAIKNIDSKNPPKRKKKTWKLTPAKKQSAPLVNKKN